MTDQITIRGARLHNLKNITLSIPKRQLVVLTGLSGSGKSTLTDIFTPIRAAFAATPEARRLGLSARHDTLRR